MSSNICYRSEEFFSLVTDKVGKGEVNEIGKRVGEWRGYVDGNVEWVVRYCEGVMDGKAEIIKYFGRENIEGYFNMGYMTGMWIFWDKKYVGRVSHIQFYLSDKKHGMFTSYYPRGNRIQESGKYEMGKRVGEWVRYNTLGEIYEMGLYDNDGKVIESDAYCDGRKIEGGMTNFEYDE